MYVVVQIEDIQGLSSGMCCKSSGSINGGCPWCATEGVYAQSKTTYPGAIRYLTGVERLPGPRKRTQPSVIHGLLRKRYAREFKNVPGYKKLATQAKPIRMTLEKANESADIVLQSKARVLFIDIFY